MRVAVLLALLVASRAAIGEQTRQQTLLSGPSWQFFGTGKEVALPEIGSSGFDAAGWQDVTVPHVFQTREHFNDLLQGWYRREFDAPASSPGRRFYLMFEGAASIADVYVNGKHLGQHRGAYTRFVFDATDAIKAGASNALAVRVDDDPKDTADCLPSGSRLYKVWGGLYRKVWLVSTDSLHVDLEDYASPGVYITPRNVSAASAELHVKVVVRNSSSASETAEVRFALLDPHGATVKTDSKLTDVTPEAPATVELYGTISQPLLWATRAPQLYHVKVEVLRGGKVVDEITQPTGFRDLVFDKNTGHVQLNGKPVILAGASLHQEIESKASAMSDDDFRDDYALVQDLGMTFIRLPHYPHAQIEYDLCDQLGIACWAENGHSNPDKPGPTADLITTEFVKQNYNHPAIVVWSVGNEAGEEVAEREVPVVKALDDTRPVVVANMKCKNADFHGYNVYPGWYGKEADHWKLPPFGFISETGAGGVTTIHCDYAAAKYKVDKYEPEEYEQLVAEAHFQTVMEDANGALGMFAWWALRDFNDVKYKKPVGINSKGLLTYAGDKKDAYYLFRSYLRPEEPTVHITSQRYFIRMGDVNNGIKAYSNAAKLTLTLNGKEISTLESGKYTQAKGHPVDHVFYWPVPLVTGKNVATVSDGAGHSDSATIYFYGAGGEPEVPDPNALVTDVKTSNPKNPAYFMDMPVQAQWPIYYDLDSNADNSFDALPAELQGAKWIAMRRVTKAGQETDLSFTVTRPATVFVMATKGSQAPSFLADGGFTEVAKSDLVWRDNKLLLVPAQLFSKKVSAGQEVHLAQPDRDEIVAIKE